MISHRIKLVLLLSMVFWPAIGCGLLDEGSAGGSDAAPATPQTASTPTPPSASTQVESATTTADELRQLFDSRSSGVMVEFEGRVDRLLRDDNEGSRHQKFIVRVGSQTVLIAHNIDLAPRAPVERGDEVRIRGQYEWNERGGVVHWTHHDPKGYREGGWIRAGGETYR